MCGKEVNKENFLIRLVKFSLNNKLKFISWVFLVTSAWMGVAEYSWEKLKLCGIDAGILSVIIPIVAAGIIQAINLYLESREAASIDELKNSLKDFNTIKNTIPVIINNFVIAIYENIDLSQEDRITLYLPYLNKFNPCSRYSRNPEFRSIKRTQYDKPHGVIKKAWENDWWFDNNLPNPSQKKEYKKYQKDKYGLTANDVKNLSMPAVLYCGKRISNSSGRDPIAILIIESTNKDSFEENDIREKLEREIDKLIPLLENETIRCYIPNQSIVDQEEGF